MAQIAMAWVLRNPVVTAPIVGATKSHHPADAAAAVDIQLTDDEAASLEQHYTVRAAGGSEQDETRTLRTLSSSARQLVSSPARQLASSPANDGEGTRDRERVSSPPPALTPRLDPPPSAPGTRANGSKRLDTRVECRHGRSKLVYNYEKHDKKLVKTFYISYAGSMTWAPSEPYNALPQLPPGVDLESKPVLKAAIEARAALASLNEATQSIPNPTVLINTLPLLEAQASSEIENIVTTTDEMFKYAQDETAATSPATREALRYRTALYRGFLSLRERPLSTNTALEVCSIIKLHEMQVRDKPGTFIGNPVTHEAIYTPPVGRDLIFEKLGNWERFLHEDLELDPLVRMAVAHYQFEAIHPFEDGNGRTGRVINVLLLVSAGLITQPILYLSRYIIENKSEYYARLQAVTSEADWESWILYTLEGIRQTSIFTMRKIAGIRELQQSFQEELRETQSGGANADLLAVLFEQPYCRIRNVMERCGVSRPTASKWLNTLVDHGVLSSLKVGRDRLYVNEQFVRLLTRDETVPPRSSSDPKLF